MPPVAALAIAFPVPPLHGTLVCVDMVILSDDAGWVIITLAVAVQL